MSHAEMAKLEPRPQIPRKKTHPEISHRYGLDKVRLLAYFGGEARVKDLCQTYGVPLPHDVRGGIPVTLNNVLLMLELAERMHQPLDLYQFVVESR
jgi:hypothetical protein